MLDLHRSAELAGLIEKHAVREGRTATPLPGLEVFRADAATPLRCAIYDPCLIIVAQGRKRAFLGGETYEYSPSSYLVLPVSLPMESRVVEADVDHPFLSFAIRIEAAALGQIMLDAGEGPPALRDSARGIAVSEMTAPMLDAAIRLVRCLDSEAETAVLAPQIVREILYRVLTGPQGDLLRAAGYHDGRLRQISRALHEIHAGYDRPLEVPDLARAARMSVSAFYEAFKAVTSLSPLQYVKEIRLNHARQIMVWEGASAKHAARRVGYSSPSQFSREFKRRFGRSPGQERHWALAHGELAESLGTPEPVPSRS